MKNEYLVLLPVEPFELGAQFPQGTKLPLHCTLMYWFVLDRYYRGDFIEDLREIAKHAAPGGEIELISKEPALFGPNKDVPVHVLESNGHLDLLHTDIFATLDQEDSLPPELWRIGGDYRPHVTTVDGRAFPPGSRHVARTIVVIERDSTKLRTVKKIIPL